MARTRRWLLWALFAGVWTTFLLLPAHAIEGLPGHEIIHGRKYLVAKSLHVIGYVVLTVLSGWLLVPARFRWLLVFFVMAHATGTELLQQVVPGRTGDLRDVGFNQLGVLLGLVITWKWWIEGEPGA